MLRRASLLAALLAAFAGATPLAAQAQDRGLVAPASGVEAPAVLVADKVYLDGRTRLVAEGNVEALQGDVRIKASRILYDRTSDRLTIEGPITITQGDDVLVLANQAEMDISWQNGLLTGARMVLNQQLQLAAHQLNRVDGRYSQLYKAAVTSCRVCGTGKPPLWQIRARRVVHDQLERQLYFDGAQFRVLDVPVFYLPRLRMPDPTLERATGFLLPSFRGTSRLGSGIRVPYFIRIGDHRDLTVTPYLSPKTRTLELRYRQAFRTGRISFEGAISDDTLTTDKYRGYLRGEGAFDLKNDFKLKFDVEMVSDKSYLFDYGNDEKNRLDSEIAVSRVRHDENIRASLVHYHSLLPGENAATLPTLIGDFAYERRYFPARAGGELRLSAGVHSHFRYSESTIDGADFNPYADGLDVARLNAEAHWLRGWTLGPGIRMGLHAGLAADQFYNTDGGATVAKTDGQITPMAAVTLRWPWQKITRNGATHIIEPVMQLSWTGGSNLNVANDETTRVEFDEANLLSLSRFPAPDRRERGTVLAYGVNWTRLGAKGLKSSLTFGQITRESPESSFSPSSGLRGTTSDLLFAGQLKTDDGLSLTARTLFDSSFSLAKGEARGSWQTPRYAFGASYIWLGPDAFEDRPSTISEWSVDGLYRFSRHWSGSANVRYDVVSQKAAEAGLGLQYRNECVEIDLSLSRRFTSSVIFVPTTDFNFTVGLKGFSAATTDKSYTRRCSY